MWLAHGCIDTNLGDVGICTGNGLRTMYSQNGEDERIVALFSERGLLIKGCGLLLDIGAWGVKDLSNSRLLIEQGWHAVLVEFSPGPVRALVQEYSKPEYNHRVTVVQAAVTPEPNHVLEFQITDDALSTRDPSVIETWRDAGGYFGRLWVQTLPLAALIEQFFGADNMDFCNIDTEGTSVDLAIALLRMERYPEVMCVEHDNRLVQFAEVYEAAGYRQVHVNQTNVIITR